MLSHSPLHLASSVRAGLWHGPRGIRQYPHTTEPCVRSRHRVMLEPTALVVLRRLSLTYSPCWRWGHGLFCSSLAATANTSHAPLPVMNKASSSRTNMLTAGGCLSRKVFHVRQASSNRDAWRHQNKSVMLYVIAGAILVVGFSYAAVPLYTVFCQATGLGGQATAGHDTEMVETMVPVPDRQIVIRFNADTAASMRWNFRPQQSEVKLVPGETALAFYSAMNPTDKPIVGISTYNVVPFEAGQYFNKIQCFCFEEQRLNPHEQVDMPVFFYIDPEFSEDPKMERVNVITLSYTFFESKEGLELPDPLSR